MTREEAKEQYDLYELSMGFVPINLVDKIYDDFESRTCENCNLLTDKFIPNTLTCRAGFNPECGGCNKFERKE